MPKAQDRVPKYRTDLDRSFTNVVLLLECACKRLESKALLTRRSCVRLAQVEFQVGDSAAIRPVEEKAWLKPTGRLPLADGRSYDGRAAADGGCDSPAQFQGCQAYYIKVPTSRECNPFC